MKIKRIVMGVVILTLVLFGSYALDQSMYLSMEASAFDVLDSKDLESLEIEAYPMATYSFGDINEEGLKGYANLSLPYQMGDSLDTLFPYFYSETFYRFQNPETESLLHIGLRTHFERIQASNSTILDLMGLGAFYPINNMEEVWTSDRYSHYSDGVRLGFGMEAGATLVNLLEDAATTTTVHAAPVGRINAGAELFDNFWVQANMLIYLPMVDYYTDSESFDYTASQTGSFSCSFVQERFQIMAGLDQRFTVYDLYTTSGLFKDTDYTYDFNPWASFNYTIMEDLNLYTGLYLYTTDGNLGPMYATIAIDYFLI